MFLRKKYFLFLLILLCNFGLQGKEIPWEILTDTTMHDLIIEADRPVILNITANNCSACKIMEPVLYQFYKQHKKKYDFLKLNFHEYKYFCLAHFKVTHTPTFIFFLDGREVGRVLGACSKNQLKQKVKEFFGE